MSSAAYVLLLATPALATPTAQLSYARAEGAESCPGTLEVRKAISQRLGYDPVDPSSPQIIAAIVEKIPTGFRARVELIAGGGSQGLRELSSSGTCAELVSAMALSMSIAIDPERAEQSLAASGAGSGTAAATQATNGQQTALTAEPAPPPPAPPPLAPPPLAPPPAQPPSRAPELPAGPERGALPRPEGLKLPVDYSVSALFEVASGFAPGTSMGGSLRVRGRHRWFSLSLEGRVDAPSTGSHFSDGAKFRGGVVALIVAPCAHYGPVFACGLGLGGEVWASSSGFRGARSDLSLYAALGARLGLDWPERGVWALALHADAFRPLTRISIHLDDRTWTAPRVAAALGAGAVVRF